MQGLWYTSSASSRGKRVYLATLRQPTRTTRPVWFSFTKTALVSLFTRKFLIFKNNRFSFLLAMLFLKDRCLTCSQCNYHPGRLILPTYVHRCLFGCYFLTIGVLPCLCVIGPVVIYPSSELFLSIMR